MQVSIHLQHVPGQGMNTQHPETQHLWPIKSFLPLMQWIICSVDTGLGLRRHTMLKVSSASSLGNSNVTMWAGQDKKSHGLTSLVSHSWARGLFCLVWMQLKGKQQDTGLCRKGNLQRHFLPFCSHLSNLYLIKQDAPPAIKAAAQTDLAICSAGGLCSARSHMYLR